LYYRNKRDLQVGFSPGNIVAGKDFTLDIHVRNLSPDGSKATAHDVWLIIQIPTGINVRSAYVEKESGTCVVYLTSREITCSLGDLIHDAEGGYTRAIRLSGSADIETFGTFPFSASVTMREDPSDPNTSNNEDSLSIDIKPIPLLQISRSPEPVTSGQILTYTYTVKNNGNGLAKNVELNLNNQPTTDVEVISITGANLCTDIPNQKKCFLGDLEPGKWIQITQKDWTAGQYPSAQRLVRQRTAMLSILLFVPSVCLSRKMLNG